MLADLIGEFLRDLAIAAVDDYAMISVFNDGGPARFVAVDQKNEVAFSMFVGPNETVRVNREFRLIVEPLDSVVIRPLCVVHNRWSTH